MVIIDTTQQNTAKVIGTITLPSQWILSSPGLLYNYNVFTCHDVETENIWYCEFFIYVIRLYRFTI